MDKQSVIKILLPLAILASPALGAEPGALDNDIPALDSGDDAIIINDSGEDEVLTIEGGDPTQGDSPQGIEPLDGDEEFIIDDEVEGPVGGDSIAEEKADTTEENPAAGSADREAEEGAFGIDDLWLEMSYFPDSNATADHQAFFHGQVSGEWQLSDHWDAKLTLRADTYLQNGDRHSEDSTLDYGDTFIRYSEENFRVTLGGQTVMWGRIDEFPPTDYLSTQDLSRYILDDLSDRRRASPALRFEYFSGNAKLDVIALPVFREAELPDKDSAWFPVNRRSGEILGLESTPVTRSIIRATPVVLDEPDGAGGGAVRFSNLTGTLDYAITVQKGRQTVPYFTFDPVRGVIETRYPRSWVLGGDIGFEALGGTVRFEAAWIGDTPATEVNGTFTTKESVTWAAAIELYPGDGDGRLNLQIIGRNMLDAGNVLDRDELYWFNGSYEVPFANHNWRFKTRFNIGLDTNDVYLNPEIAYTGWTSREVYLEAHYFSGANGTPGGFHEDNSVIAIGWRGKF